MTPDAFFQRYQFRACPWGRQRNVLYHFTDTRNLPLIKEHGGLLSWTELERRGISPPAPGGNQWSRDADAMFGQDRFVHLCLHNRHPMEAVARRERRVESTVFLEIDFSVVNEAGVRFTPDVANKSGVPMLAHAEAVAQMDFDVVFDYHNWSDREVQARMAPTRRYEILIPASVPLGLIRNI